MTMLRKITIAAIAGAALAAATPVFAGPEVNTAPGQVLVNGKPAPGLAVHGYDVVAYHSQQRPVQGEAKFATVHEGATYRFASQANLDSFKASPARYAPAYGGYCAYGVAVGAKFDGDPRFWKVVDGKLYLNLSGDIQDAWNKDISGNIKKAEVNWQKLEKKAPDAIN